MSNPTDTNQASEDELRGKIRCLLGYCEVNNHPCTYESSRNASQELDEIMQLIRTEKLKLLAEVRERVVGSLEPQNENGLLPDRVDRRNQLRIEELEVLTKLEAEL